MQPFEINANISSDHPTGRDWLIFHCPQERLSSYPSSLNFRTDSTLTPATAALCYESSCLPSNINIDSESFDPLKRDQFTTLQDRPSPCLAQTSTSRDTVSSLPSVCSLKDPAVEFLPRVYDTCTFDRDTGRQQIGCHHQYTKNDLVIVIDNRQSQYIQSSLMHATPLTAQVSKSRSSLGDSSDSDGELESRISLSPSWVSSLTISRASSPQREAVAYNNRISNESDERLISCMSDKQIFQPAQPVHAAPDSAPYQAVRQLSPLSRLNIPHNCPSQNTVKQSGADFSSDSIIPFRQRNLASQRPSSTYSSAVSIMWEADQSPTDQHEIQVDSASDEDSFYRNEVSQNPSSSEHLKVDEILTLQEETTKKSTRVITPRLRDEIHRHYHDNGYNRSLYEATIPMPVLKNPELSSTSPNCDSENHVKLPLRTVSEDYPIPKWMIKKKVFLGSYRCPYRYTKTFTGSHGVINYDIEGNPDDSIVLCFHGLNATRLTFQEFQDVFSKYQYCVITFDLYGHGLSRSPKYRNSFSPCFCRFTKKVVTYGLEFFIQQAEELLEHLGLSNRQLSICGFSMGGVIAAGYTQKHLKQVERLILVSTAGMLAEKPPLPVRLLKCCRCCIPCFPKCICRCCCNRQRFMKKFQKEEIESGVAEALWSRFMWQLFVKKGVIEAFLGSVANVPMWSAEEIFRDVGTSNIPVLILWGRGDAVAPVTSAMRVLDCFPNGHLITFDRCSHLLLADQPQAAIALLLTFLEFPRDCEMKEWRYLLPFSPKGIYVPRENRCPEGYTYRSFLQHLNFCPRLLVKLPRAPVPSNQSPTSSQSKVSTHTTSC